LGASPAAQLLPKAQQRWLASVMELALLEELMETVLPQPAILLAGMAAVQEMEPELRLLSPQQSVR
jgi:hypothetical protein